MASRSWIRRLFARRLGHTPPAGARHRTAPARSRPPRLEYLEDRVVPSILYSSSGSRTVTDGGGPVITHADVDLVFWGTGWNSGGGPALRSSLQTADSSILTGPYLTGLSQYRGVSSGHLLRSDTITSSSPGSQLTDAEVDNMLKTNIANGTLPSPTSDSQLLYMVIPQTGSSSGNLTGSHGTDVVNGNRFHYGWTINFGGAVDPLTIYFSSALTDAVTDPEVSFHRAFYVPSTNDEIADGEAGYYNYRLNGYLVQSSLSQATHSYNIYNGTTQNFLVSNQDVLTVNGDQLANHNDTISVDTSDIDIKVTLNGESVQFDPGFYGYGPITISSGTGSDIIEVNNTPLGIPVTITSTGAASVYLGSASSSVQGLQGDVSISNTSNYTAVQLDDSQDVTPRNVTVTASTLTGLAPATISYAQAGLAGLVIIGGGGNDTYTVSDTPSNAGHHPVTQIITGYIGSSTGTVNVRGTTGALTIDGSTVFGGTDVAETVNVGSQAPASGGTLANITGPVTLTNTASTSALTVDDSGDSSARTGTVSATSVTGLGMGAGAAINYIGNQLASLTVGGGSGGNTIAVTGTSTATTVHPGFGSTVNVQAAASALTIDADNGLATVNVGSQAPNLGGTLANITAPVTVTNSSGALNVDDSGDSTGRVSTVSGTQITGLGLGAGGVLNYNGSATRLSSLTVHASNGGTNGITVTGTPANTTLSAGAATVNVQATSGALTIDGGGATDQVNVGSQAPNLGGTLSGITGSITVTNTSLTALSLDDSGDGTAEAGTITGTAVTGLGMPAGVAVNYTGSTLASLTVYTGSGGAAVTASGTSTSTAVIGDGSASNTLVGPDAATTWNITGGNAGAIPGLNLTFSGFQSLSGGAGDNTFVFSDGAALSGTLTGGGGSNTLDSSAYSSAEAFTLTGTDAGTGTPVGAFANIQNLIADAAGGSYFQLADGSRLDGNLAGGGGATLDYTPYTTSVVVDLEPSVASATGVGGSVSGITSVIGASGAPGTAGLYNLLIGSDVGGDTLQGGTGRRNILVAGGGASTLIGGDGEDLLIGGTTAYDTDPALTNWLAIAAYWAGTDDFATRSANLQSGNGVPLLDATTVTGNGGGNTMQGHGGTALIYTDGQDAIDNGFASTSLVTIAP